MKIIKETKIRKQIIERNNRAQKIFVNISETASLSSRTLATSRVAVKSNPHVTTEISHVVTAEAKAILPNPEGPITLAKYGKVIKGNK